MDKKPFRIVPVIDLKGGLAVHAVRGERVHYQPVSSVLTGTPELFPLVAAFAIKLGLTEAYIADLDAITGGQPAGNLAVIGAAQKALRGMTGAATPISLMVDAGVASRADAAGVFAAGAAKAVVGTETLASIADLADLVDDYGPRRVVVSLDCRDGRIISPVAELRGLAPPAAIRLLRASGAAQFILLELTRVGTAAGLNRPLIKACVDSLASLPDKAASTDLSLFVGGGVSGWADLEWLKQADVAGALVATALHDGRLTGDDIRALMLQ